MKRYYLSPIIGTGTEEDPYRASLSSKGKNYISIIPVNSSGIPIFSWALCLVNTVDHSTILNDSTIDALPDITLESTLSVLKTNERNNLINKLTQYGIDMTGITSSSTFREVLIRIGIFADTTFNIDKFNVIE